MLGSYWEIDPVWLGSLGTLNTSECPSDAAESSLWQILQPTAPLKYYLSPTACRGILRRVEKRGKPLPERLETALLIQSGALQLPAGNQSRGPVREQAIAFAANQRDEVRDLHDRAGTVSAQPGMKQQTFVASFSTGAGSSAGSIAYSTRVAPTLKGSASGNCMPSVLCLNDQGGQAMGCMENMTGTLRAQEHGHPPLVMPCGLYENHGIDGRYRGPLSVAPTLSARAGTGGNNLSLIAQSAFARNRADCFVSGMIAST